MRNEGAGGRHRLRLRVSLLRGTEDSINTVFADLTVSMPDGPDKILKTAEDLGIPEWNKNRAASTTSTTAPASSRSRASPSARPRSPRQHGQRLRHHRQRRPAAQAHVSTKVTDQDGEPLYTVQAAHRAGGLRGRRGGHVVRHAAGRQVRHRYRRAGPRPTRRRQDRYGDQRAGPGRRSSWFVGYTPQLATAVMYVRGKGQGQLDGWLPEYFGGSLPGAHLDRRDGRATSRAPRRRTFPHAGQPRRRGTRRRPRAVHAAAADRPRSRSRRRLRRTTERDPDGDPARRAAPTRGPRPTSRPTRRRRPIPVTTPATPPVDAARPRRGRVGRERRGRRRVRQG